MNKNAASVEAYIRSFPPSVQKTLKKIRALVRKEAPGASEKICYGIPTFHWKENLVHYAGFKEHVSFFPTSSGVKNFQAQLKGYECSRGTIQFPHGSAIPYPLLSEIVRFRVREAANRTKKSKSRNAPRSRRAGAVR